MSAGRKQRKGFIAQPRPLTIMEKRELQQLHLIASSEAFKLAQIKGNSVMFPRKDFIEDVTALANLLQNVRNDWIAAKLLELGYPRGYQAIIDFATGEITPA